MWDICEVNATENTTDHGDKEGMKLRRATGTGSFRLSTIQTREIAHTTPAPIKISFLTMINIY